jgi:mannose-6-phosphate isomerase-like protein (cupin superfamily)
MDEELKLGPGTTLQVIAHDERMLQLRATYAAGGAATPAHLHPEQDERFEVLAGAMRNRIAGRDGELREGEVLEIGRGTAHQMWNAADVPAVVDWRTTPAGRTLD